MTQFLKTSNDHQISSFIFTKLLAVIHLIAFSSIAFQIHGLIGFSGILPAIELTEMTYQHFGWLSYFYYPSLFWLMPSDLTLTILSYGGVFISLLILCGVMPGFLFLVLWMFYLSLVNISPPFMNFQWDNLLLETTFLTIFLSPWKFKQTLNNTPNPPIILVWLFRFLIFKLMFQSGMVKLLGNDPTWKNLTALDYHFYTQPLVHALSWYAHQLPSLLHQIMVGFTFVLEIILPIGIFINRKSRIVAALGILFLMMVIIATGNYGFFNLIPMVLILFCLDDSFIKKIIYKKSSNPNIENSILKKKFIILFAIFYLSVGLFQIAASSRVNSRLFLWSRKMMVFLYPFKSINNYGLFANMTTKRLEIIFEGSNDGKNWQEYEFKFKPDKLDEKPPFLIGHMPRLDWQMWFVALGSAKENEWIYNLISHMALGTKEVLDLLDTNPFDQKPPRYIRALAYDYEFTNWDEKNKTQNWWKRKLIKVYVPTVELME